MNCASTSFLVYSPRGTSEKSQRSRVLVNAIKSDRSIGSPPSPAIDRVVARLAAGPDEMDVLSFLGADRVLVPAPRSGLLTKHGLWPARRICESLRAHGLGVRTEAFLERLKAVRKSATAGPGERPTPAAHFDSIVVKPSIAQPRRVTIVDDVVTKGVTLLGAAMRLRKAFPECEVHAFALVRTMGFVEDIAEIIDPCVGRIRMSGGNAGREP